MRRPTRPTGAPSTPAGLTQVLHDAVALTPTAAVLLTLSLDQLTAAAKPEQIVIDMFRSFVDEFFVDVVAWLCPDDGAARLAATSSRRARAQRRLEHIASRDSRLIPAAFQSVHAAEVSVDALIAATTSVLTAAYAADKPVFRSHRTFPKRRLFFELEQHLKIFFPVFFVRPPPTRSPPTPVGASLITVIGAVAVYNDIVDTGQLFHFVCLRGIPLSHSFPPLNGMFSFF